MGTYGPSGGQGGGNDPGFQAGNLAIVQIKIWSGLYVNAIAMLDQNAVIQGTNGLVFGNANTGPLAATIGLQPGEYLTEIVGRYGDYVDSIAILTNFNRSFPGGGGVYGGPGGSTQYVYRVSPGEEIHGFFGRTGAWIDAIAVISQPHV